MKSKSILAMLLGFAALIAFYTFNPDFNRVQAAQPTSGKQPTNQTNDANQPTANLNITGIPIAAGTFTPGPAGTLAPAQIGTGTPRITGTITATGILTGTPAITTTGTITTSKQISATKTAESTVQITGTPIITGTLQVTPTIASTPLPPIWGDIKPRDSIRAYLPRVIKAIIIMLFGWLVAIIARKSVNKALFTINPEVRFFLGKLTFAGVIVAASLWALSVLQVYFATLATILGTVGLAVSLASQDLIKNLVAGVYLLLEHPFGVGDELTIGNYTGKVMIIDLRTTMLHTDDNQDVLVPNTLIMSQVVVKQLEVVEKSPEAQETEQTDQKNSNGEDNPPADSEDHEQKK